MALTRQEINKNHQAKQKQIRESQRGGIPAESWHTFSDKPKSAIVYKTDMAAVGFRRAIEERAAQKTESLYGY